MMLLWSVVDAAAVFDTGEHREALREVVFGHVTMMVSPQDNGMGKIERLISPNALDYLKPEWQPGEMIALLK